MAFFIHSRGEEVIFQDYFLEGGWRYLDIHSEGAGFNLDQYGGRSNGRMFSLSIMKGGVFPLFILLKFCCIFWIFSDYFSTLH